MRIDVFQGVDRCWYWHFVSSNGRITANGESHPSKGKAVRAAKGVVRAVLKPVLGGTAIRWDETIARHGGFTIRWY